MVDALVNIYCGIYNKKQFYYNALDMILHVLASLIFIGTLVLQDLLELTNFKISVVVNPTPLAVFYLLCVTSFLS